MYACAKAVHYAQKEESVNRGRRGGGRERESGIKTWRREEEKKEKNKKYVYSTIQRSTL